MSQKTERQKQAKGQAANSRKKAAPSHVYTRGYFESHLDHHAADKRLVARYVCEHLVREGDSIALDAGTSPMYVAEVLFKDYYYRNLSILTHNMDVFNKFGAGYGKSSQSLPSGECMEGTNIQLILTGGEFSRSYNALFGIQTENAYNEYYPRLVILAVSGLTCPDQVEYASGLFCHAVNERQVKKLLFEKPTERRVVVADWSKLGMYDSFLFGELSMLTSGVAKGATIVTTRPPESATPENKRLFDTMVARLENVHKVHLVAICPETGRE